MNLRSLPAYLRERFPPVTMTLFVVLFATVWSVAGLAGGGPYGVGWAEVLGSLATISFFFRLRVFDEVKDFAQDAVNHPQRVLQSGRIDLPTLQRLAWGGAALEAAWSASRGWPALLGWAGAVAYSLVMRYEFFAPTWLRARLLLYATTHMLIMPAVIGWLWLAYAPHAVGKPHLPTLAALSLLGGFAFELARKIHAPEAERAGVDSYSRTLGFGGSIGAVLAVLAAGVAVQVYLLRLIRDGAHAWPYWLLAGLYAATALVYFRALRTPREATLRQAEVLTSLFMLTSYVSVIVEASH